MGLSHWLTERMPKTGSGVQSPPGTRSRGKIKAAAVIFRDKTGKVIPPVKPKK
jgi:hypothetical protein